MNRILRRAGSPRALPGAILEELRARRYRALGETTVTSLTQHGLMTFRTGPDESIGRSLWVHRAYELDFADAALAFLRGIGRLGPAGTGTLLDIGANNGVTTVGMLTRGEVARSVALEPEPRNFELLLCNLEQNNLGARAMPLRLAAAQAEGVLELELSVGNFGDHRVRVGSNAAAEGRFGESKRLTIKVLGRSVDAIVADLPFEFQDLTLVWIDVQGFEAAVIRGGTHLWASGVPVVTELWPYGLRRAGMNRDDFTELVRQHWSSFAHPDVSGFVERPMEHFGEFYDEVEAGGKFTNVIYLPS